MANHPAVLSDYSSLVRGFLLTRGFSTDHRIMCRELAERTGFEYGYCHHLLTAGGAISLHDLDQFCSTFKVQVSELFKFNAPATSVDPLVARNPYSSIPISFYLSTLEAKEHSSYPLFWINGQKFDNAIQFSDVVVFSSFDQVNFVTGRLYMLFYEDDYSIGRCVKSNAFYSSFLKEDGAELVRMNNKQNVHHPSQEFLAHHILLTFNTHFDQQ